ncbi:MAG: hypothetical protein QXT45_06310 [Candidatus Bilamarchaeaceae archaeon]
MAKIFGGVQSVVTFPNFAAFTAQVITVTAAGTPVQLPNIVVPEGASLFVRARLENGNKRIFLADSAVNVGNANTRLTLRAGEGVELNVQNANLVFIDASANGAQVELFVEQ